MYGQTFIFLLLASLTNDIFANDLHQDPAQPPAINKIPLSETQILLVVVGVVLSVITIILMSCACFYYGVCVGKCCCYGRNKRAYVEPKFNY